MGKKSSQKTAYLALDELAANPKLARRLPADLARCFRALPLAEDNGCVTVAMADPDDVVARNAVVAALGPTPCVVQGDPMTIDSLLTEIWGDQAHDPLDVLVCAFPAPIADEVRDYAEAIADLLDARMDRVNTAAGLDSLTAETGYAACDLIIFAETDHPLIHRLLSKASDRVPIPQQNTVPFAVLTARRPRWPLESILLLVCGEDRDVAAVDWVLRLARRSGSAVTVLAIVPPVPAMYGKRAGMDQGLPALLTTETPLGRQMRRVARQLVDSEIEGTLRLRQGPPDWQIRREVSEGEYDLIAVAAKPCHWWQRWLEGDLVSSLLRWTDRPVLVAKPTTA